MTLEGVANFKLHIEAYHGIKSQSQNNLTCRTSQCGATFNRPYRLYEHLLKNHCRSDANYKTHNPLDIFSCPTVQQTTKSMPFNAFITKMISEARQSTTLTGADSVN